VALSLVSLVRSMMIWPQLIFGNRANHCRTLR
jgi:hypothetical protein